MAVPRVERLAKLPVMPANPGESSLQRGDVRTFSALSEPVRAGGEIEPDRLRIGRQL